MQPKNSLALYGTRRLPFDNLPACLRAESSRDARTGSLELIEIRGLIEANPLWHDQRLSVALAQRWQCYAPLGRLKDMTAGAHLLKLHERSSSCCRNGGERRPSGR